jgi:hypothetical protein
MREIEKIQQKLFDYVMHEESLILSWINQAYNLGLQDAADNIKHGVWYPDAPYSGNTGSEYYVDDKDIGKPASYIDKESILKLKL